jgi:hypothetical protein
VRSRQWYGRERFFGFNFFAGEQGFEAAAAARLMHFRCSDGADA